MPRAILQKDPVDAHVGARLRLRRNMLGMTQEVLGKAVGVSFQMVQKYERGACRVGASRLMKIANTLGVEVSWFFEGSGTKKPKLKAAEEKAALSDDLLQRKETIELLKAYYALPEAARKHVLGMVKGLKEKK